MALPNFIFESQFPNRSDYISIEDLETVKEPFSSTYPVTTEGAALELHKQKMYNSIGKPNSNSKQSLISERTRLYESTELPKCTGLSMQTPRSMNLNLDDSMVVLGFFGSNDKLDIPNIDETELFSFICPTYGTTEAYSCLPTSMLPGDPSGNDKKGGNSASSSFLRIGNFDSSMFFKFPHQTVSKPSAVVDDGDETITNNEDNDSNNSSAVANEKTRLTEHEESMPKIQSSIVQSFSQFKLFSKSE